MPNPEPTTLRLRIYWSYANLAMAHSALNKERSTYGRTNYMVRARLYKGLRTGTMNMGTLLDDERVKLEVPRCCAYCGSGAALTMDHVMPRDRGGPDSADNIVWVCRSCNSSKGATDLLSWWSQRDAGFPPLLLLRRYLKLAYRAGETATALDLPLAALPPLPFDPQSIPDKYPPPSDCTLWMEPG